MTPPERTVEGAGVQLHRSIGTPGLCTHYAK